MPVLHALPALVRALAAVAGLAAMAGSAAALSQIDPGESGASGSKEGIIAVPLPPVEDGSAPQDDALPVGDPAMPADAASPLDPAEVPPDPALPPAGPPASTLAPSGTPAAPAPRVEPVRYGEDGLPRPVRDLRRRLIDLARAGDVEALRPYIETGAEPTILTFGDNPADPIEHLKDASGDGEGAELLAILIEVLEAGHAHVEAGEEDEIFVWPYFAEADLEALTRRQKVELFELVTAGDYEMMLGFGAYNFYRVGISPEGRLAFFVAGD